MCELATPLVLVGLPPVVTAANLHALLRRCNGCQWGMGGGGRPTLRRRTYWYVHGNVRTHAPASVHAAMAYPKSYPPPPSSPATSLRSVGGGVGDHSLTRPLRLFRFSWGLFQGPPPSPTTTNHQLTSSCPLLPALSSSWWHHSFERERAGPTVCVCARFFCHFHAPRTPAVERSSQHVGGRGEKEGEGEAEGEGEEEEHEEQEEEKSQEEREEQEDATLIKRKFTRAQPRRLDALRCTMSGTLRPPFQFQALPSIRCAPSLPAVLPPSSVHPCISVHQSPSLAAVTQHNQRNHPPDRPRTTPPPPPKRHHQRT
jgi:hypothetical protein